MVLRKCQVVSMHKQQNHKDSVRPDSVSITLRSISIKVFKIFKIDNFDRKLI